MRVYVSGPMRGMPLQNAPLFDAVSKLLRDLGYEVVNPADISRAMLSERGLSDSTQIPDVEYIKADLAAMETCDALVLLPHWEQSKGVKVELAFANFVGMKIFQSVDHLLGEEKAA